MTEPRPTSTLPTGTKRRWDLVIFDCDGVLVDSEVLSLEDLGARLTEQGWAIDAAEVAERFMGRSGAVVEAGFLAATGRPLPPGFIDRFHAALIDRFHDGLKPIEGVGAALARLDVPCCLASTSAPHRIRLSLRLTGLEAFFADRIFDASMVARGKPAPDLFLLAARRMGVDPSRCLVIEDSPSGIVAAKAAGMTAWGFVGGSHYRDYVDPVQLTAAGADRIVRTMAELDPATTEAGR